MPKKLVSIAVRGFKRVVKALRGELPYNVTNNSSVLSNCSSWLR